MFAGPITHAAPSHVQDHVSRSTGAPTDPEIWQQGSRNYCWNVALSQGFWERVLAPEPACPASAPSTPHGQLQGQTTSVGPIPAPCPASWRSA